MVAFVLCRRADLALGPEPPQIGDIDLVRCIGAGALSWNYSIDVVTEGHVFGARTLSLRVANRFRYPCAPSWLQETPSGFYLRLFCAWWSGIWKVSLRHRTLALLLLLLTPCLTKTLKSPSVIRLRNVLVDLARSNGKRESFTRVWGVLARHLRDICFDLQGHG